LLLSTSTRLLDDKPLAPTFTPTENLTSEIFLEELILKAYSCDQKIKSLKNCEESYWTFVDVSYKEVILETERCLGQYHEYP